MIITTAEDQLRFEENVCRRFHYESGGVQRTKFLNFQDLTHCNPAECKEILGEVSHGYGESFWIKDGDVLYADRGYHNGPLTRLLKKRIKEFSGIEVEVPGDGQEGAFASMVMRNCQGLDPAVIEIYDLECREISDLDFGVVTMYHPNHARAITTVRALANSLREVADPRIRLIVLHSDAVSRQDMRRIFGEPFGSGSTYWIRKGKVVAADHESNKGEVDLLARRIKSLRKELVEPSVV